MFKTKFIKEDLAINPWEDINELNPKIKNLK